MLVSLAYGTCVVWHKWCMRGRLVTCKPSWSLMLINNKLYTVQKSLKIITPGRDSNLFWYHYSVFLFFIFRFFQSPPPPFPRMTTFSIFIARSGYLFRSTDSSIVFRHHPHQYHSLQYIKSIGHFYSLSQLLKTCQAYMRKFIENKQNNIINISNPFIPCG